MKKTFYWILFWLTIALVLCFAGFLIADYINYDPVVTSAPFDVCIIVRGIEFLIPAIITFIASLIIKKKLK